MRTAGATPPLPTRAGAAWYWLRVARQVGLRWLRDLGPSAPRRLAGSDALAAAPIVARHRSPLWSEGPAEEFILVAGKVHNLRLAAAAFDGIVVPAGASLSFWRQLGRPRAAGGYVVGREIRAGCVVPTLAGGLCQLSNALVACAGAAGLEIVERWRHTARTDSLAPETGGLAADATVFWNYLDLRLRGAGQWRLEVELDGEALEVRVRSHDPRSSAGAAMSATNAGGATRAVEPDVRPSRPRLAISRDDAPSPVVARGCLSCEETSCFRHGRHAALGARRAALVATWQPEMAAWLASQAGAVDRFEPWRRSRRRHPSSWPATACNGSRATVQLAAGLNLIDARLHRGEGHALPALARRQHARLAQAYAQRLRPEQTHLVVEQPLLEPLAASGALGGRSYDVFATTLPAAEVQKRLDAAAARWPLDASLRDFRIDAATLRDELPLLRRARRVVTAHREVARHLHACGLTQVELVDWATPALASLAPGPASAAVGTAGGDQRQPLRVGLPASALARKGARELAAALRELGGSVLVLGTASSDPALWDGVECRHAGYASDWLAAVDVVALPAHVEHSPRAVLRARAAGLPVVVTPACGLAPGPGLFEVEAGDVAALCDALLAAARWRRVLPAAA